MMRERYLHQLLLYFILSDERRLDSISFFHFTIESFFLNLLIYYTIKVMQGAQGTSDKLDFRQEIPQKIEEDEIVYQLDQCDDLDGSDQKNNDQTSFVDVPTERKGNNKKEKFQNFLQNNRTSLPTTRNQDGNLQDQLDSIQNVQNINRNLEDFILAFNKKPAQAIDDYITKGFIPDEDPKSIAEYLMGVQGLDKSVMGEYFGKNKPQVLKILHQYCKLLDFNGMQFDRALRKLLSKFRLPGQAQQIQRVIWQFSLSFYEQNKDSYDNADQLFPLAYSIIMLATDAHNPKQQKKMLSAQFVKNTQRPCPSIGKQYLEHIYERITKEKLQTQHSYWETIYARLKDMDIPNIMEALKYTKELKTGDVVLKICRDTSKVPFADKTNKFVQRRLFLSDDQQRINWVSDPAKGQETPRYILIKDITDLTLGIAPHLKRKKKTEQQQKEKKKGVPDQFDSLCFTITTNHRHLDLKAKSTKQRSKWLNYLRAIMIQRRQAKRQELEKYYDLVLSKQSLQEAWNSQIFPNWDKYWDYQLKKPKMRGIFTRGLEALCCCFQDTSKENEKQHHMLGIPIKNNMLETCWKFGLPHSSRKTLWVEIIGNPLELNQIMILDIKKRKIQSKKLRQIQQKQEIIEMAQFLITLRPDLPHVKDLLEMSKVFQQVIPISQSSSSLQKNLPGNQNRLVSMANLIHKHHFLAFYRGERSQIQLRTKLFQFLLEKNVPSVLSHFQAIKLETRMYLVAWFLSVFAMSFKDEFLFRIWDNFLLQGELYLFKVGIAIIKYYEIELKMCTFYEGLKVLKFPKHDTSAVLFFHILQNDIEVKADYYQEYIEKRKHAVIKTKVQSIPLQ